MNYHYEIHIDKQGKLRVIEEDIERALEKQGIDLRSDTYLEESDDDHFILDIPIRVKQSQLKQDLEALDGHDHCQVTIEEIKRR